MRTLGLVALALQAQATPDAGTGIDFVHLIANATWTAKSVLLILLLFSAVSWGIILYKLWQFRRAARNTSMFLQVFRKSTKFSEVQAVCASVTASPLVGIFQAGYAELNLQLRRDGSKGETPKPGHPASSLVQRLRASTPSIEHCCSATTVEVARLEKGVPFRDDSEHHAVHRTVRDGVGGSWSRSRGSARRIHEPSRSWRPASPKRSSDGRGPVRRRAGRVFLQRQHESGEGFANEMTISLEFPEHLGEEFLRRCYGD